jgi:hypothetical protein
MKEEFNKDMECLRKKESNRNPGNKIPLNKIKITVESHSSRLKQVEDRISGHKDKIDIKGKKKKNYQTKDSRTVKGIYKNSANQKTPSKD